MTKLIGSTSCLVLALGGLTGLLTVSGANAQIAANDITLRTGSDIVRPRFVRSTGTIEADQLFPVMAELSDDVYIVAYEDRSLRGADQDGGTIRAQVFSVSNSFNESERFFVTEPEGPQAQPAVTSLGGGRFVIAWVSTNSAFADPDSSIRARLLNIDNSLSDGEFLVNTTVDGAQSRPEIATLDGGGFVVTWVDKSNAVSQGDDIRAQIFDHDGNPVGNEHIVNATLPGDQNDHGVAGLPGGGYFVVWEDDSGVVSSGFGPTVIGRAFDASGLPATGEIVIAQNTGGIQQNPDIARLTFGDVAIVWEDYSGIGGDAQGGAIKARRFAGGGSAIGAEFRVNSTIEGDQTQPAVSSFVGDGFIVAWADGSETIRAQIVDRNDQLIEEEWVPSNASSGRNLQTGPSQRDLVDIVGLSSGGFAVSWPYNTASSSGDAMIASALFRSDTIFADRATAIDPTRNDQIDQNTTVTGVNGIAFSEGAPILLASGATVSLINNELVFDPTGNAALLPLAQGETAEDSFSYSISNGAESSSATATIIVTGVNELPVLGELTLEFVEGEGLRNVNSEIFDAVIDPDSDPEDIQWSSLGQPQRGTVSTASNSDILFDPDGEFTFLGEGEVGTDEFLIRFRDDFGIGEIFYVQIEVTGINSEPVAGPVAFNLSERSGPIDITAQLLSASIDPDQNDVLGVAAVDTNSATGALSISNGVVLYDPRTAFDALGDGETAQDSFAFEVEDSSGRSDFAVATITIDGVSGYILTTGTTGLGEGTVTSDPAGLNCSAGGTDCETNFEGEVTLTATAQAGSVFAGWAGNCPDPAATNCTVTINKEETITARFELDEPVDGFVAAATAPGARSGFVGGPPITALMSVVSGADVPLQNCSISAPPETPGMFGYQFTDAQNIAFGGQNPSFDLTEGAVQSFVFAVTPTQATGEDGYLLLPQVTCDNAVSAQIDGVNSVLLSIDEVAPPDIISIAVTASGDGVLRITEPGGVGALSAAAINIGVGDGSGAPGDAEITVTADTGSSPLPLTLEVCETDSLGACLGPRSQSVTTTIGTSGISFFTAFAFADPAQGIALDPATARVFLRFEGSDGTLRSVASVAITSPDAETN